MTKPDYHNHEEFQNRLRKLSEIQQEGINPYPHNYSFTHQVGQLHKDYDGRDVGRSEDAEANKTTPVRVAGRLVLFRSMGKNTFAQIQDGGERIQVMFNRDQTNLVGYRPEGDTTAYKFIEKKIDLGDILGIDGYLFRTQKGELTVYAKNVTLLCKTLLPLAEKHSGLSDKELRYRKRWLDLISNPEVQNSFRTRSQIIRMVRDYFEKAGFIEVETPVVQSIYGGAEARPFTTELNALNQEMFLRISLEIPLKKLIVGGMERVFELGKVFRNEGIDRTHNPEFTMLEAYAAYLDYNDMMKLVEELFQTIALSLFGSTQVTVTSDEGKPILVDMKAPWVRLSMKDAIKQYGGIDSDSLSDEEMRKKLSQSGHIDSKKLAGLNRGLMIAALFEVYAEPHLIQPHHIIDHPMETTPLCKLHRDPTERDRGIVERFESFILGHEICNAYSELNDPVLQRKLLEEQAHRRESGDEEASPLDEEFLEAICQGMPPAGGVGIGIDRLVMLFLNAHSIRDVLYFPWMKPEESIGKENEEAK